MKKTIQRNLPLDAAYRLIGVSYSSIEETVCSCDNCGRLICNIAEVQNTVTGVYYNIGTDCLESILANNSLLDNESYIQYLFSDKPAIQKAKSLRAKILKGKKGNSGYKAELHTGEKCFGFSFYIESKNLRNELVSTPLGFDYTFHLKYKELTLAYIKDLIN